MFNKKYKYVVARVGECLSFTELTPGLVPYGCPNPPKDPTCRAK